MKIGIVQASTGGDKVKNLSFLCRAIDRLAAEGADLISLPETFGYLGPDDGLRANAEPADGPTWTQLRERAGALGVWLHCGSLLESRDGHLFNTTVVYDRAGNEAARYSKVHLFDIEAPGGTVYRESDLVEAGDGLVVFDLEGWRVGLSICYDLRFPELYRKLADMGATLILVPAAFTRATGRDHWQVLLRARAIENLCYVAAANTCGTCPPKYDSWGHSMVVDPWGTIVAEAGSEPATLCCELDLERLQMLRAKLPSLSHRRKDLFPG